MNVEIYQISAGQFEAMMPEALPEERKAAKLAAEIIVGLYDEKPLCFIGLIPLTFLSDQAYIWMILTDHGAKHRLLLARYGWGFVKTVLLKYNILRGHCFTPLAVRWLKHLGAVFVSETDFELRRG